MAKTLPFQKPDFPYLIKPDEELATKLRNKVS